MTTEICSRGELFTPNYTTNQNQNQTPRGQRNLETEASVLQGRHFIFSQTKLNSDLENKLLNKGNLVCSRGGIEGSKDDELVKYMSNLPGYLRRHPSRNKNEQEKALSVGVLDWGRLERWKKKQTHTLQTNTSISTSGGDSFSGSVQNSSSFREKNDPEGEYSLRDGGQTNLTFPSVEHQQKIVLLLPKDLPRKSFSNSSQSKEVDDRICDVRRSFSDVMYPTYTNPTSQIPHSCPLPCTPRITVLPTEGKTTQLRNFPDTCTPKGLRISSGIGNVGRSFSVAERPTRGAQTRILASNGPSGSVSITKDDGTLARSRSSPLRRLLDPILKPWSEKTEKQKSCQGQESSDGCDFSTATSIDSSPVPALLQLRFKNGFPLFKFMTEGKSNGEALVATLKKSDDSLSETSHWVYTFYSVREAKKKKKKNHGWAHSGNKEKGRYVYGVVGWMNVIGSKDRSTVKSVLLGDDCGQQRELAAIISEVTNSASELSYGKKDNPESEYVCGMHRDIHNVNQFEGRNPPSKTTTVILPNGIHGVPSEGGLPSCLVDRWRSGGSCDCGGWDIGCQIKVLKNHDISGASSSSYGNIFQIFFQGRSERPALMMVERKEGIYSVKLDSTLSLLQAFSICVSFLPPHHQQVAVETEEDEDIRKYTTPFPPPSPAGRV